MSLKNVGEYKEQDNNTMETTRHSSSGSTQPLLSQNNPIQLAALTNYKLAQLTFSPPNWNSMRKTALIKNMADVIYNDTPAEWLDQMRRWQFFTPESLSDMTQDGLELIFGQYIQTMEAFKPINLNDNDDDDDDDDFDDDDDELWPDDEILTPNDLQPTLYANGSTSSTTVPVIMEYPLYAHSGASFSTELLAPKDLKPLPAPPSTTVPNIQPRWTVATSSSSSSSSSSPPERKQQHRKSIGNMRNRLSWTSDTGLLANSTVGLAWANELMTMFNMEFQVDTSLHLTTATVSAPTLPELPFSARHDNQQKRQSHRKSQRYSTDSFMNLIPAFESFKLEEPLDRRPGAAVIRSKTISFPPPPPTTPPPPHLMAGSISTSISRQRSSSQPEIYHQHTNSTKSAPMRSSSLRLKSQPVSANESLSSSSSSKSKSSADGLLNGLVNTFSSAAVAGGKPSLAKKRSIRRLASLVTGIKSKSGYDNENGRKNDSDSNAKQLASTFPLPETVVTTTTTVTNPTSTLPSSETASLNRISASSKIYHSSLPISPTHSSAPLKSMNSTSHLSVSSSSDSSASTRSMLMVASKTPSLHLKPLPDIPPPCTDNDDRRHERGHHRRTSYSMSRPVIVEVADLRRSRSAGSRPKKSDISLKGKQNCQSKDGNDAQSAALQFAAPMIIQRPSSSSLTSPPPPSTAFTLTDSPPKSTSASPSPLTGPPKRSKSTLMRIGSGLSKGHKKLLTARKTDAEVTKEMGTHASDDLNKSNFVKRITSFRKRMTLQRT